MTELMGHDTHRIRTKTAAWRVLFNYIGVHFDTECSDPIGGDWEVLTKIWLFR